MFRFRFLMVGSLFVLFSCTPSGGLPRFVEEEATPFSQDSPAPAINDELARRAGLKEIVFHVGPVDLPPHTAALSMRERPLLMRFQMSEPVWIIGFVPRVIDSHGEDLSGTLLDRALFSNMHEENPLCSSDVSGNPFAIANTLLTEIHFPEGYGYPVLPTDPLEARVSFKNESDQSFTDVSYEITFLVKPMSELVALKELRAVLIDFEGCNQEPLDVPPGEFSERSTTISLAEGGGILLAHGILQDFAASLALVKGEGPLPFWKSSAVLDEAHHIVSLENNPFEDPAGIPIANDEPVTFDVAYNNFSDRWQESVAAAVMLYLSSE